MPRQPITDAHITSQKRKIDPEVIIKHDDLYARAWESEYETLIFDNDRHEPGSDNSPEITLSPNLAKEDIFTFPGTIREASPEIFPKQMK